MAQNIAQWQETELVLTASGTYANPYTDLSAWAVFTHESGRTIRRPAYWDGGNTWRVRFAPPLVGKWAWKAASTPNDAGVASRSGDITIGPNASPNRFHRHGLLRMSPKGRNVIHHDGTPFLVVADTPWALPWRATIEQCRIYAADRQRKGFNAALLMSVQPDMKATGPRDRTQEGGFDVGFDDLPLGHINQINIGYFQYLDKLIDLLVEHQIAPVWQPVFHGYGWKGLQVAGKVIPGPEYSRYCRYLVARYGARPALWLIGGDGDGFAPGVDPGGYEVHRWDDYEQPTGIHYQPHATNRAWQDREWLDFQWCQTGHNGEHIPERVADMWRNHPVKAVANGEPTYERIGHPDKATGWWQGHEAWMNLCAGGTMGVVYGAGSLWQWRLSASEPGHQGWCHAKAAGWREALDFEGSNYVGIIGRIFDGLPFTDMEPNWTYAYGGRHLVVPGKLMIRYCEAGGTFNIISDLVPRRYRIIDPRNGKTVGQGELPASGGQINTATAEPRVVIFAD